MAATPKIRPQVPLRQIVSQCPHPKRTFSTAISLRAQSNSGDMSARLRKSMSGQKSLQSYMKNLKRGDIPNDLGMLPQTFIKPEWNDLPSLLSSKFRRRLRIEWMALTQKVKDFLALYYLSRWAVKKDPVTQKRQKLPMFLGGRYATARRLQKELYSAIAEGNRTELNKVACQGLLRQTKIRLDHRKAAKLPSENWKIEYRGLTPPDRAWWLFHALCPFKSTRIVADRSAELPFGKDNKIRQIVVKIKSRQTLEKGDGNGPTIKNVDEYMVFQQLTSDGQAEDWMVWGSTKPTADSEIDELLAAPKTSQSMWDRMKERMEGMTSSGGPPTM